MPEALMSATPILTDALIARIMLEQRRELRPPSGWGYAAWPFRAETALATLTPEGWCNVGWIERGNHRRVKHPPRYQIWWQVDTGEVRRDDPRVLKVRGLDDPQHEQDGHDPNDR
jgi:hypothetical protein